MYQVIQPPEHLNRFIDFFWQGDDEDIADEAKTYHSIATSKLELLFFEQGRYLTQESSGSTRQVFKAGFYGQSTGYSHYFAPTGRTIILGVRFLPLALLVLFDMPASEVTNQKIGFELIGGVKSHELSEKVFEATTFREKANILVSFFTSLLKPLPLKYTYVEKALVHLQHSPKQHLIQDLVAQSHLSSRQFERIFKEMTGFSAKTYLKLIRFEALVERLGAHQAARSRLTDIALSMGFYDQSHLNRHFKEFTGLSPIEYVRSTK